MLLRLLSLEEIEVSDCDKATHIFGHIGAAITDIETRLLSNLRRIQLRSLRELQEIWIGLNPESPAISLNKLTEVEISYCTKLSYIFPACVAESLELLQVIKLEGCLNLKSIVAKGTQGNQPVYFSNLRVIEVVRCPSLKSLFSVAEARNLRHLETMEVRNSDNITELISHDDTGGGGGESMIQLPKLSALLMKGLPNMSRLCAKSFTVDLPSLEDLVIVECPIMEVVKSIIDVDQGGLSSLKSLTVEDCKETVFMMNVPARDAPALLSNLEELDLSKLHNMEDICRSSLPEGSLHKLITLKVEYCEKLDPIVTGLMLLRLFSLEEIEVNYCDKATHIFGHFGTAITGIETRLLSNLRRIELSSLPELQEIWIGLNPESPAISLNKLTEVDIINCPKLSYIFPACVAESLVLLQVIKLEGCSNLKSIVAKGTQGNQPVYFSNLTVIEVKECTSLKSLFSVAEARNLQHLETMEVRNSDNITELISHDDTGGGGGESMIQLPKLSALLMEGLPNMSRLCAKSFTVDLPSLEDLVIVECPIMESNGVDLTKLGLEDLPMLKRAKIGKQNNASDTKDDGDDDEDFSGEEGGEDEDDDDDPENVHPTKDKGAEREKLFEGGSSDTKPRTRTREEIIAEDRKTGDATSAASQAKDKLQEKLEPGFSHCLG